MKTDSKLTNMMAVTFIGLIMDNYSLSTTPCRLLLVEDDLELANLVQEYLAKNGFDVSTIHDGNEAVEVIRKTVPNLVILDVMLPGISGIEVCRQLRPSYSGPILMLTALDEDMDQMLGLELGADDYVIKPVKPRLLLSRLRALLRRVGQGGATPKPGLIADHLMIDLKSRTVSLAGELISLTTAEFDLLLLLAKHATAVVSRETIVQSLRGFDYDGLDRSIDRRISRLRKKLNDDSAEPFIIKTVRGKGYLLCQNTTIVRVDSE